MHRLRASFQAIMVGVNTVIADNPRLDCRLWPAAHRPLPVSRESSRLPDDSHFMQREHILRGAGEHLEDFLNRLYTDNKITALLVEGGRETLQELLDLGLFDMLRVETSPALLFRPLSTRVARPCRRLSGASIPIALFFAVRSEYGGIICRSTYPGPLYKSFF